MVAVLGDRETVIGFRMAGVKGCYETGPENLKENLGRVAGERIIIINERLFRRVENKGDKIFIPVPDKFGQEDVGEIRKMIREIIGNVRYS